MKFWRKGFRFKVAGKPRIRQIPNNVARNKRMSVSSNVGQAISSTLNYQLMVAYEASASRDSRRKINEGFFKEIDSGFGAYMDAKSLSNPAELQHVYEWRGLGKDRLFRLRKSYSEDGFRLSFSFLGSRRVAPIAPVLKIPGPTGKVVTKSSVFQRKAEVIESGMPVTIRPKNGKFLAIPGESISLNGRGIVFSKGPIVVRNPGGSESTLGFTKSFNSWMGSQASNTLRNGKTVKRYRAAAKRAGEGVPSKIRRLRMTGRVSASEVEAMAKIAVSRELS